MSRINTCRSTVIELRAALAALVEWNEHNGGYGELPPLIHAAESALRNSNWLLAPIKQESET